MVTRFLVKFLKDDGFLIEILVKGEDAIPAFQDARHRIATEHPGIGNLHLFSIEKGVLSDVGWVKEKEILLAPPEDPSPFFQTKRELEQLKELTVREEVTPQEVWFLRIDGPGINLLGQWDQDNGYTLSYMKRHPLHAEHRAGETFPNEARFNQRVNELLSLLRVGPGVNLWNR